MGGFDTYLSAAILKKKVPVMVVDDRSKADFIVAGSSHVEKAGWAKTIFVSPAPHAEASITIKDVHNGSLVFAYNVDKLNAARANQSTAEACAKHLKEAIEEKQYRSHFPVDLAVAPCTHSVFKRMGHPAVRGFRCGSCAG